jgi:hypothetical protein
MSDVITVVRSVEYFFSTLCKDGAPILDTDFFYIECLYGRPLRVVGPVQIQSISSFEDNETSPFIGVLDRNGDHRQLSVRELVKHGICLSEYEIKVLFENRLRAFESNPARQKVYARMLSEPVQPV